MKLIGGRLILSYCSNSISSSSRGGGVLNFRNGNHLCIIQRIAASIFTDRGGSNENLIPKEKDDDILKDSDAAEKREDFVSSMPVYAKLKDDDILISKALTSVKSKKNQKSGNKILLEGSRLIADAIKYGAIPEMVFFSRKEDIAKIRWPEENFEMYKVGYRILQKWSSLTSSPGVIGIFKKPNITAREGDNKIMPLQIICDNIRDPGNLGSILRVAAGVGCRQVVLTKGCVELWEPKVLRSGAGAHFILPVHSDRTWDKIPTEFLNEYSTVVLADNSSEVVNMEAESTMTRYDIPIEKYLMVDYSGAWDDGSDVVLVLGGETAGLSADACELAYSRGGVRLNIPLCYGIESLNASTALGIIAFEIRRQFDEWLRRNESLPSKSSSEI
ncbi:rRNA methyltransferase 3, mitochondrial [Ischnura elegans]|uniref:rRNA methyltransferase 3, mitochondrial n=1 Tax=Ischnura elegans TaxID=197161 RepID=UPI001ED88514|nr:rRNA methyltransferase 3, mitochondrial [Ischnura elegans]